MQSILTCSLLGRSGAFGETKSTKSLISGIEGEIFDSRCIEGRVGETGHWSPNIYVDGNKDVDKIIMLYLSS